MVAGAVAERMALTMDRWEMTFIQRPWQGGPPAIGTNFLNDELFEKAYRLYGDADEVVDDIDDIVAFAVGDQIYIRRGSSSIASDAVHEGTHSLDSLSGLDNSLDDISLEKRAYFFERQFQESIGGAVEFSSIEEMLKHIFKEY